MRSMGFSSDYAISHSKRGNIGVFLATTHIIYTSNHAAITITLKSLEHAHQRHERESEKDLCTAAFASTWLLGVSSSRYLIVSCISSKEGREG
jgi:hypothetical protein